MHQKQLSEIYFGTAMKAVLGERPEITRKPAPDAPYKMMEMLNVNAEECLYIGDADVDVIFAKNAGVPCIAVTWGSVTEWNWKRLNLLLS